MSKIDLKSNPNIRYITIGALFVAIGVILPQAFHYIYTNAGKVFLPMYLPVMIAPFFLPTRFSVIVSLLTPLLSFMLTSMPGIPMFYFMLCEFISFAVIIPLIKKPLAKALSGDKPTPVYFVYSVVAVLIVIIVGKLVNALSVVAVGYIFLQPTPYASVAMFLSSIYTAIPGMTIQLILIPTILYICNKEVFKNGR